MPIQILMDLEQDPDCHQIGSPAAAEAVLRAPLMKEPHRTDEQ